MKRAHQTLKAALVLISVLALFAGPGKAWAGPDQASGILSVSEESGSPDSKEADELEKELQGLIEELKALGKDVGKTFRKEILPRVREEIRKLREKLRELEREEEPEGENTRRI